MFDFNKLRAGWPAVTAFGMSSLIVARSFGYMTQITDEAANQLMMTAGGVLGLLAVRSGMNAQANASNVTAAASVANAAVAGATYQAQVIESQSAALQEASRAVVAAAVSLPTASVIAAAGQAAEVVNQVVEQARYDAEQKG